MQNDDVQEQQPILFDTNIKIIKTRFYFHDQLTSSSNFSKHYIVEDLQAEVDASDENNTQNFYYLKQTIYPLKKEYIYAKSYAQKLHQCGNSKFSKSDMIKLNFIYFHENEKTGVYELVQIYDFGEPDRINLEEIETQHINKFLRNICNLLLDIKNYDDLYHSNIEIQNIVLVNSELKISGFKPRFILNEKYRSWKMDMIRAYGHHRLDLFLIGLLWMKFLKIKTVDIIEKESKNVTEILAKTKNLIMNENIDSRAEIVKKLVDVHNYPHVTVEDVLISFDENSVLESIHNSIKKEEPNDFYPIGNEPSSFQPVTPNHFENLMMKMSESKASNVFFKDIKENENDVGTVREPTINKDQHQYLDYAELMTLGHNENDRKFEENEQNYIEVMDGKAIKANEELIDSKGLSGPNRKFSHKEFKIEIEHTNDTNLMRKIHSNQELLRNKPTGYFEDVLPKKDKLDKIEEVPESDNFKNIKKSVFKKKTAEKPMEEVFEKPEEDSQFSFDNLLKKAEESEEMTNLKIRNNEIKSKKGADAYNSIKSNGKNDAEAKEAEKREKEKQQKLKIDKKITETLDKRKNIKPEIVTKTKQNLKQKKEFDSKQAKEIAVSSQKELIAVTKSTDKNQKSTLELLNKKLEKSGTTKEVDKKNHLNSNIPEFKIENIAKMEQDFNSEFSSKSDKEVNFTHTEKQESKRQPEQSREFKEMSPILSEVNNDEIINIFGYFSNQNDSRDTVGFMSNQQNNSHDSRMYIKSEILENQFKTSLSIIKTLFIEENYIECLDILKRFNSIENKTLLIDFFKLNSLVYFKMRKFDESKEELFHALRILQINEDVVSPKQSLQSLLVNIALIEFELKNFDEVVEILQNKIFEDEENLSKDHFLLLADSFYHLDLFTAAFFNYDKSLQYLMANDLHPRNIPEFQSIAHKIVTCLSKMNELDVILKFISSMVEILNKYKPVLTRKEERSNKTIEVVRTVEMFIISILRLLISLENKDHVKAYLILLFENKVISINHVFEHNETKLLIDISNNFIHSETDEIVRKKLFKSAYYFVNFIVDDLKKNETIFALNFLKASLVSKNKNHEKLLSLFERTLELEISENSRYFDKVYLVLYNIGICYWHLGKIDEASFYFDKVMVDRFIDEKTEVKVLKILCKIYFELKILSNCKLILDDLIITQFDKPSFLKYMIMYFICCESEKFENVDTYFFELYEKKLLDSEDSELAMIGFLLLMKKAISERNFFTANRLVNHQKFILLFSRDYRSNLLFDLNKLSLKLMSNLYNEALEISKNLQKEIPDNEHELGLSVRNFLLNLRYALLTKLEINNDNFADKQNEINDLLSLKEQFHIYDDVFNLLKEQSNRIHSVSFISEGKSSNFIKVNEGVLGYFSDGQKKEEINNQNHQTAPQPRSQNEIEDLRTDLYKNIQKSEMSEIHETIELASDQSIEVHGIKRVKRAKSSELLERSNFRKAKCCCFEFGRKNTDLVKLIKEFSSTVKYSNGGYDAFSKLIVDLKEKINLKKLRFLKYSYIKKISTLTYKFVHKSPVDHKELASGFEEILADKDICVHDLRRIITMLESASSEKINFLELFIQYLDTQHKALLRTVMTQFFLPVFQKNYQEMIAGFYDKIYNSPNYYYKDFALMHYLDFQKTEKEYPSEKLKRDRLRFKFLSDQCNFYICSKYLSRKDLTTVYFSNSIKTLLSGILEDKPNEHVLLNEFRTNIQNTITNFSLSEFGSKNFAYEFFACVLSLKTISNINIIEEVFDVMIFIESKTTIRDLYHFSIVCSLVGNLFFAFHFYDECLKIKHVSHICLKKITEVEMVFPPYFVPIDPFVLMYNILSFNIVCNLELEKVEKAKGALAKLKQIKFENPNLEFEKKLLSAFVETLHGKFNIAKELTGELEKSLGKVPESKRTRDMFSTIITKMKALIEKSEKGN